MKTRHISQRHEPLRVVAIGGGTGLSTLLKGLRRFAAPPAMIDLTAVVTVTDDGGSSGRLRREFEVLPPGDIRNCMAALAEDEALLTQLFQYRFEQGRGLKGHSFGNLLLTAMTRITGDFSRAVQLSSEVLAIAGRIYPSTGSNVSLRAVLADGSHVQGETNISRSRQRIGRIELVPASCNPLPETLDAIRQADLITLGPGSLYTSVVPNLLVEGIANAIRRSRALKACFVNLMWQPGETVGLSASEHIKAMFDHAGLRVVDLAVLNTAPISRPKIRRYAELMAEPVENDVEELRRMGLAVVGLDLLAHTAKVRHDPEKTAAIAYQLAKKGRRRRLHPA